MKTKVLNSNIYSEVTLNGTMEVVSDNFKLEVQGYMKVTCDELGILRVDEAEEDSEQWTFRGDKVANFFILKERLTKEGYTDLMEEIAKLQDVVFNCLTPEDYPRLKAIFEVDQILLWSELSDADKILVKMGIILKNFEKEKYQTRLDNCNKLLGFNFEGTPEELAANTATLEQFTDRFNLLREASSKVGPLLKH